MEDCSTERKALPFVKWAGGKRQLVPEILKRMPESFGAYFEPFVGGGALFFKLSPQRAVINDINPVLIFAYKQVRDNLDALIEALTDIDRLASTSEDPKEFYTNSRALYNKKNLTGDRDVELIALFLYLNKNCFNGLYRVNRKGEFNVPYNGKLRPAFSEQNLRCASRELKGATILNVDFEEACGDAKEGDFVFFDSPYAPLNANSFEAYTVSGFSMEEHKRLAKLFRTLSDKGCYCLLTNHNTELIQDLYSDYMIEAVQVKRYINSDVSKRTGVEVLIRNYE